MKILIVVGTRPNFVKIAPLVDEIVRKNKGAKKKIQYKIVHTGQHYDFEMSKIFFQELNIPKPHYDLGIGGGLHGWQTGKTMEKLEIVALKEKPDILLVLGDVNATLAGAVVASKLHIPIVHIEAGMRSFNRLMPEEINRVLTDHISKYNFCSTKTAVENLKNEGIKKGVYNVGDIMFDTFLAGTRIARKKSKILKKLGVKQGDYYLATIHRAENTEDKKKLRNIIDAFCEVDNLLFPCHPRTVKYLKDYKIWDKAKKRIKIIKPVGYIDMLWLEKSAKKILTDSGGVQKEAYFAKVPCITLRNETEWVETVKDKWNILVGTERNKIAKAVKKFSPKGSQHNYFGNGKTAREIVSILSKEFL
jgi:UDP-N-acetylglucosamine 2-epimerase